VDSQKLTRRIERFLIFRLAVIPMAFILVAIYRPSLAPPFREQAFRLLYGLLGFYTLLSLGALAALHRARDRRWFAVSQVVIDFLVSAVLIWSTGGVGSVFCPLLFATLFNASTVLRGRGVLVFASLSTAFLALTMIGYQLGQGPATSPWSGRTPHLSPAGAASHLFAMGLALHAVALLGTRLSRGLLNAQSLQAEIIENMAEGLVAVDRDRRILEVNGEARRIFGLPADLPCLGRPLAQVFSGEKLRPVREAFLGAERRRFEFALQRPDGGSQPVEAKVSQVADEGGRLRCRIGLFGDLTLKKEVEEAEKRIHKLEELYDMALGIAHEIRNPLASIQGCAQEISRFSTQNPQELKLVDIICRESSRLDRIIEEFLSHARRGPGERRPLDLVQLLEETVLQLKNHPQAGGRRFVVETPSRPVWIAGDAQRLKQVFLNLGINAIDATDPQGGEIRVRFREREFMAMDRRRAGERRMVPGVEVEFSDNGSGIPPEAVKLLFTPFFTTKEKGHGLGLTVVHRILQDHLGAVDVESEPGGGTRFRIWFPRLRREEEAAEGDRTPALQEALHG
jgi:two-component system sensor histidine kinase PilS (NtrC family)